jgi:hypothetical protein
VFGSSQGLYLNTGRHKYRLNTQTYKTTMPFMGFQPMIPDSERAKTVHALDHSAIVIAYEQKMEDIFFLICLVGVESNWVHSARRPLIGLFQPAPGDYDGGECGGMKIGRGNRSTRREPAPAPLCPPQIPLNQTRDRTRDAVVGSLRLTA